MMVTKYLSMVLFTVNVRGRGTVRVVSRVIFVEIGPVDEHRVGPTTFIVRRDVETNDIELNRFSTDRTVVNSLFFVRRTGTALEVSQGGRSEVEIQVVNRRAQFVTAVIPINDCLKIIRVRLLLDDGRPDSWNDDQVGLAA